MHLRKAVHPHSATVGVVLHLSVRVQLVYVLQQRSLAVKNLQSHLHLQSLR